MFVDRHDTSRLVGFVYKNRTVLCSAFYFLGACLRGTHHGILIPVEMVSLLLSLFRG